MVTKRTNNNRRTIRRRTKPRRQFKPERLVVLFLLILVFVFVAGFLGYRALHYTDGLINNCDRAAGFGVPVYDSGKFTLRPDRNVLVVGLDKARGTPNADYMAVFSCGMRTPGLAMVFQLPVGSVVTLSGAKAAETLQQTYRSGGIAGVANILINRYNIPVTDWLILDFSAMQRLVDIAGGMDIYVEKSFDYDDRYSDTAIHIKSGFQHFDGKTAVDYARLCNDDLSYDGRSKRQARIIREMWPKIFSYKLLENPRELYDFVSTGIKTNMDMLKLFTTFRAMKTDSNNKIEVLTAPGKYDGRTQLFTIDESRMQAFVFGTYYYDIHTK